MLFYIASTLSLLISVVSGSALTFTLGAQETSCFYIFTTQPSTSVSFYFAVQSGGAFDVDYTIKNPRGEVIVSEDKQRQGDFFFTADATGEYEFCFANEMSTFAEKVVDFEIKFEEEDGYNFRANMPEQPNAKPIAHVESMQQTVDSIDQQLDGLARTLQYYKTRNNRNQATVKSTESRIYYFSIFEVLLMVGMAFLQITIVQLFFKGSRKQLV
ncbi:endoplasmic reticulum vesicle protein 25 [[Candida] railenensis]|uniref:Endoplasmic reticulum vesicle protein 25 n=1 Tax=[Candida] railenensis TaxID=45579 RepID=A0A9P0QUX3_9ASCO|nr:endoplasmic reticulum vesicle protein 25 [[Candida] railenensis]